MIDLLEISVMLCKLYKKRHKLKKRKFSKSYLSIVQFGSFGLKALTFGILTTYQLETIRRIFTRLTNRSVKILVRIFFQQPITKKSLGLRMGRGTGSLKYWISYVKIGSILLEISAVSYPMVKKAMFYTKLKLSVKVGICKRIID